MQTTITIDEPIHINVLRDLKILKGGLNMK